MSLAGLIEFEPIVVDGVDQGIDPADAPIAIAPSPNTLMLPVDTLLGPAPQPDQTTVQAEQVEAVEPIALEGVSTPAGGLPVLWVIAVSAFVALAVTVWLGLTYGRRTGRPDEDAFIVLARNLRIARGERELLRRLASTVDAQPVALLMCRSAYLRASDSCIDAEPSLAERIDALERRLFSDERSLLVGRTS